MLSNESTELRCPEHLLTLVPDRDRVKESSVLLCERGCRVPVVRGIPRFVESANYAAGFGLQWKAFSKTQLDSHTSLTISRDRLAGALGGSLEVLQGKSVLEVGCGAGRFTEVMLEAAAPAFPPPPPAAVQAQLYKFPTLPPH